MVKRRGGLKGLAPAQTPGGNPLQQQTNRGKEQETVNMRIGLKDLAPPQPPRSALLHRQGSKDPPKTTQPAATSSPGTAVTRASMASVVCKSSGPALRCSLFCSVCLISALSSLGMSFLRRRGGQEETLLNVNNRQGAAEQRVLISALSSLGMSFLGSGQARRNRIKREQPRAEQGGAEQRVLELFGDVVPAEWAGQTADQPLPGQTVRLILISQRQRLAGTTLPSSGSTGNYSSSMCPHLCAMSRMRVSGTLCVKRSVKEGSRLWEGHRGAMCN